MNIEEIKNELEKISRIKNELKKEIGKRMADLPKELKHKIGEIKVITQPTAGGIEQVSSIWESLIIAETVGEEKIKELERKNVSTNAEPPLEPLEITGPPDIDTNQQKVVSKPTEKIVSGPQPKKEPLIAESPPQGPQPKQA